MQVKLLDISNIMCQLLLYLYFVNNSFVQVTCTYFKMIRLHVKVILLFINSTFCVILLYILLKRKVDKIHCLLVKLKKYDIFVLFFIPKKRFIFYKLLLLCKFFHRYPSHGSLCTERRCSLAIIISFLLPPILCIPSYLVSIVAFFGSGKHK